MNTTFNTKSKENFDGLEMPATMQLQRVNRKMNCWDRTQELIEKQKIISQQRAKTIIQNEDKIQAKIDKNRTTLSKMKAESFKDKKDKWFATLQKN